MLSHEGGKMRTESMQCKELTAERTCRPCDCFDAGEVTLQQPLADENVDQSNRAADVQLASPNRVGSPSVRWNVQPATADAAALNADSKKSAVLSKQVDRSQAQAAVHTRESTRSQPARKRKG